MLSGAPRAYYSSIRTIGSCCFAPLARTCRGYGARRAAASNPARRTAQAARRELWEETGLRAQNRASDMEATAQVSLGWCAARGTPALLRCPLLAIRAGLLPVDARGGRGDQRAPLVVAARDRRLARALRAAAARGAASGGAARRGACDAVRLRRVGSPGSLEGDGALPLQAAPAVLLSPQRAAATCSSTAVIPGTLSVWTLTN